MIALGVRRRFPAHAVLMLQDERDDRLLLLLTGRVKVSRAADGDHELLLAIRGGGELLGELAFIDGLERLATVTALEPVEAVVIPGRAFREHLEGTPRTALTLLEIVSSRLREATVRRLQFAASDTLGRLASRIVELADLYGEPGDGALTLQMPITQDELADWTGASRAGVSSALQTLRRLGWITTERRRLTVHDLDALRARAA